MENMKKYDKLKNRGFDISKFKETGLVVQEKLDGSNASFTINKDTGELEVFSRQTKLGENNTLNGFLGWVEDFMETASDELKEILKHNIIFGEWLVKHKVQYKEDTYKQFYVFDIFHKKNRFYRDPMEVEYLATKNNLKTVHYFAEIDANYLSDCDEEELKDMDFTVRSFIGKSNLTDGGLHGEGIVIKPNLERSEEVVCYKIVTDTFKEFSKRKMNNEKKSNESIADYAITRARMEKQIFKAIDEARLNKEDIIIENFGKVIKEVGQNFVDDIFEEEMEQMKKIIEKQIKKKMSVILREILQDEEF